MLTLLLCLAATGDARPNVLLYITDDQSFPHCSAYGTPGIFTPSFDRVAKSGVLFANCYAGSPGCSPSRAALLTGRHAWSIEHAGTHASSFPLKFRTYPERLAEAGYLTGFTGKGWGPGNYKVDGRTQNPAGKSYAKRKTKPANSGLSRVDYAANFADFLADREEDQPFCFWYGAQEPHRPYEDGAAVAEGKTLDHAAPPSFLPDTPVVRSDVLDYYAEIEYADRHLGLILDQLEAAGELENTLVICTADNGMPFPRAKANGYEFGIHVPLAISFPKRVASRPDVEDAIIGFVDLTATILDAVDITPEADAPQHHGRSLFDDVFAEEADTDSRAAFASRERHSSSRYKNWTYPQRMMRRGDHLLLVNDRPNRWPAGDPSFLANGKPQPPHSAYFDIDGSPTKTELIERRTKFPELFRAAVDKRPRVELFNVTTDPSCSENLATSEPDTTETLLQRLNAERERTGDPRADPENNVFETYKRYSKLREFAKPPAELPE